MNKLIELLEENARLKEENQQLRNAIERQLIWAEAVSEGAKAYLIGLIESLSPEEKQTASRSVQNEEVAFLNSMFRPLFFDSNHKPDTP